MGQDIVLEHDDAGDRVDALRLHCGDLRVNVLDDDRPQRARLQRGGHLGPVGDQPPVALDVDDHGVELGALHQLEHALADGPVGDAVVGEIGGPDGLRTKPDGGLRAREGKLLALVAG